MKKYLMFVAAAFALAACSSTWHGVKEDTSRNVEKTGDAVKAGGRAVGQGLSNTGDKLQEISQ
ncbi:MAG: hypothetical protein Q4A62_05420 [Eikenella sp.]|nr:hypothetical protein [Eikenella sp.]